MNKELILALEALEQEKRIKKEVMFEALEAALVTAYKKNFGASYNCFAEVNRETGDMRVYCTKVVVEEVEDDFFEISLEDAHETNPELNIGDLYEIPVSIDNFMRATAMHVKTVLKQKVREAEKEAIYNEYIDKKDEIISGIIEKVQEKFVLVNLGRVIAIMPSNQWVATENYRIGDSINVYVVDVVKDSKKSSPVLVSRNHPNFLRRVMEREINEIYDGTVEIRSIAREAGDRSKVAVSTNMPNVESNDNCKDILNIAKGDVIKINGKIQIPEIMNNPGEFKYKYYLYSNNIYGEITANKIEGKVEYTDFDLPRV